MSVKLYHGDALQVLSKLPDESVHVCVTSPPYYGLMVFGDDIEGLGLESTSEAYVAKLVIIFRELWRVLSKDGVVWLNIGDSFNTYAGTSGPGGTQRFLRRSKVAPRRVRSGRRDPTRKTKDLLGIPWRVALALQADRWYLRSDVIWRKSNPAPESRVVDRPHRAHEYVFLLTKSERNTRAEMSEDARWSVWTDIDNVGRCDKHPADFPPALAYQCLDSTRLGQGTVVIDPFCGSGTTLMVADRLECDAIGIDIVEEYVELSRRRVHEDAPFFSAPIVMGPETWKGPS